MLCIVDCVAIKVAQDKVEPQIEPDSHAVAIQLPNLLAVLSFEDTELHWSRLDIYI